MPLAPIEQELRVNERKIGETTHLTYIFDALCGWCYGFSSTFVEFCNRHRDSLPCEVISGGLFVNERRKPLAVFPYISGANARITQLTGAVFGEPFDALVRDGTLILDSEAAAAGFVALRTQAPEQSVALAAAMQSAFFRDGKSLSDPATYAEIAAAFNLSSDAVIAEFANPTATIEALQDFSKADELEARSFPRLLLHVDGQTHTLAQGFAPLERLEEKLAGFIGRSRI